MERKEALVLHLDPVPTIYTKELLLPSSLLPTPAPSRPPPTPRAPPIKADEMDPFMDISYGKY